jgi:hypothetical protein
MGIANLKGVTKVPEPNGDHIVQVVLESGETIEATISPDFAVLGSCVAAGNCRTG